MLEKLVAIGSRVENHLIFKGALMCCKFFAPNLFGTSTNHWHFSPNKKWL